ncbi:MAG TPA: M20/M25/M40 family metallo-hydrolase, partial [Candidatus Thermoplasmatota archaeon]|nr:M20/M25/M40 family metallo-hydrolase [Candidatus Thermoplasmatota archaeon]
MPATMLSKYRLHPVFFVNRTIHINQSTSINLWDWEKNDSSLQAKFNITERKNENIESYNVICEVPGKNQSKSIMISGGHHDYFPGQGAADNTVGVATMLGILRWLNESNITPEYNITFVSWAGEERIFRGSSSYVFNQSNYCKNENITYMINLDFFAYDSPGSILNIITSTNAFCNSVSNITNRTDYSKRTQYGIRVTEEDGKHYKIADGAKPLYLCYVDDSPLNKKLGPFKKKTDLQIVTVGKPNMRDIVRHRSGGNFEFGDVLNHINQTDLNCTAEMVLNITKYLVLEPPENVFVNCSYTPFDLCGDGWNDSVNISFNVTTNLTSWATAKACLYNITTGQPVSDVNETSFTIYKGTNTSGHLAVTLYPIIANGTYNASIRIYDDRMNLDDECHQLINLSPYGKPIANYDYELSGLINHSVDFTDTSMASPGADIDEWYWNFDDGTHSHEQNPSHLYLLSKDYTVTLTVWDTNDFNDSWSDTLTIPNSSPYTSFTISDYAVNVETELSFTSTSTDEDGTIENYTWDFGDQSVSYEENPDHSYTQSGVYTVTLTTIDDDDATNMTTKSDCLIIANALVDDDFHDDPDAHEWDTIQEGINDVDNGGIIFVYNGSYDAIEINKPVALYGESRQGTFISGGDTVVQITDRNVSVNGFTVNGGTNGFDVYVKYDENHSSNVTIKNCDISENSNIGVLLNQSNDCLIENCSFTKNTYGVKIINNSEHNIIKKSVFSYCTYGVYVANSSSNFIGSPSISSPYPTDCLFTYNDTAMYLKNAEYNFILGCDIDGAPNPGIASTKGICLDDAENNTISTCYIHDVTNTGVYLHDSTWNKIEHSKIIKNPNGITFANSPENLIVQNHFGINTEYAIYLPSNSQNNHIYYNDFFVNGNSSTNQSWDANDERGKENLWSKEGNNTLTKTGPGEGNYWSDYTGGDEDQDGIGDTPYLLNSSGAERNDSYPVMEPYGWCDFTQDSTPPEFSNVSSTPSTVGFGSNVTISASITDNSSNISIVKVNIIYQNQSIGNYTMDDVGGSTYQYTFTDTWTVGQYNYTLWAMDETYNTNSSSEYHFHISANATISIATLKDNYSGNEYINITDPPNPTENLTLVGRGLTWDEYYNAITGQNILEVSTGPVNYQENNGTWTPINNTLNQITSTHPAYNYGYRTGNDRGLFGVYFKPNIQSDWPIAFTYNRSDNPTTSVIRSKLIGVGYVDPSSNWTYQYLQNVQSSQAQTNGNAITYEDVFTGTDVTWSYENTELKEAITMNNATKTALQNHPPSLYGLNNASSYLVFITKLDHQNLNLYNASELLNGNVTICDQGVDFKDTLGRFKCALPLGEAYELNNESMREKLTYRIVHLNGNTYLLSGLKLSDLNSMMFPVVIDPTLTVYSSSSDGYRSYQSTNYQSCWNATTGNGFYGAYNIFIGQNKQSTTYTIYRGYVYFNTSSLPSNAYIDSATLGLYKSSDYSTTNFLITVQNGQPTYPHDPLQTADYNRAYYSGDGGTLNTDSFGNGYNNITLNSDGLSWINRTGWTKLCLRSSRDINGNTPTGNEYVSVYTSEQGSSYTPKLVIAYRNQSKIKNNGSTDIKGYLLIQVQFYDDEAEPGAWIVENDTVNETSP